MSKKVPLGVTIALIFVTIAVTVAVTINVYMRIYNTLIEDLPQRAQLYSKLSEIDELVRANFHGDVNSYVLDENIARGYIDGLNDKYSKYMSAEEYATYYNSSLGNVSGTGINAIFDEDLGYITVTSVIPDSPAAAAGIEKGDCIVSVEGQDVTKDNYSELLTLFDGEKLTGINLEIAKTDDEGNVDDGVRSSVNVAKGYKTKSVFHSVNGTVGYIHISGFYENTAELLKNAIAQLNQNGVTGIILDVRNNSGVNYDYATEVIDLFVPLATEGTGAIGTSKKTDGEVIKLYPADAACITLPMAIIVNGETSGAAELLACDLRDFGMAEIVGTKTAGHGTIQTVFRLNDGGAVLLTVGKMYPYISESYDVTGVVPDEEVKLSADSIDFSDEAIKDDAQYKAAYEALTK